MDNIDEVKKLIQTGFDLELISFELDIPLKEIKQIKKEMYKQIKQNEYEQKESTNSKVYSYSEIVNIRNKEAHEKMENMRARYRRLYLKSNVTNNVVQKELSEEEINKINSCITKIQNIIEEMKANPKHEQKKRFKDILVEIKKVKNYQLTIEQAEQLNILLNAEVLQKVSSSVREEMYIYFSDYRNLIVGKLAKAIDIAQYQAEDIEKLRTLNKKLTIEMEKQKFILVSSVKNRINNKILKIQQEKASRNDLSENILGIINDLVSGTIDIEKANVIIEEEAKKRVDSKPKTRFSLTEQQEKKQILIQIENAIKEQAYRFHIKEPETTIFQIQELCENDLAQAVRIVVQNFISEKKFEEAKNICDKFAKKDLESKNLKEWKYLRILIRNAEISDIVLKGINIKGTEEEERKYIELLEKGIKNGNVKLNAISLGKSKDGLRNITLADIWTDENQIEKDK